MSAILGNNFGLVIEILKFLKKLISLFLHFRTVNTLHFSPSTNSDEPPKWLLSGSADKTLKVWNVADVERVECSLSCTAFHAVCPPDQSSDFLIATVGSDNHIQVCSLTKTGYTFIFRIISVVAF